MGQRNLTSKEYDVVKKKRRLRATGAIPQKVTMPDGTEERIVGEKERNKRVLERQQPDGSCGPCTTEVGMTDSERKNETIRN